MEFHPLTVEQLPLLKIQFTTLFHNHPDPYNIVSRIFALKYSLDQSPIRGICWRAFFRIVSGNPTSEWLEQLTAVRKHYDYLLSVYNPTVTDQSEEELQIIEIDLQRLFVNIPFFQQSSVQNILSRVLTIWALNHKKILYRQGMHEIIACLYAVLYNGSFHIDDTPANTQADDIKKAFGDGTLDHTESSLPLASDDRVDSLLLTLIDDKYLEHDLYAMFDAFMAITETWFFDYEWHTQMNEIRKRRNMSSLAPSATSSSSASSTSPSDAPESNPAQDNKQAEDAAVTQEEHLSGQAPSATTPIHASQQSVLFLSPSSSSSSTASSPSSPSDVYAEGPAILRYSQFLFRLLALRRPSLHQRFVDFDIEPQLFLLRWLRVLFLREFEMDIVLCMWDAIFASNCPTLQMMGDEEGDDEDERENEEEVEKKAVPPPPVPSAPFSIESMLHTSSSPPVPPPSSSSSPPLPPPSSSSSTAPPPTSSLPYDPCQLLPPFPWRLLPGHFALVGEICLAMVSAMEPFLMDPHTDINAALVLLTNFPAKRYDDATGFLYTAIQQWQKTEGDRRRKREKKEAKGKEQKPSASSILPALWLGDDSVTELGNPLFLYWAEEEEKERAKVKEGEEELLTEMGSDSAYGSLSSDAAPQAPPSSPPSTAPPQKKKKNWFKDLFKHAPRTSQQQQSIARLSRKASSSFLIVEVPARVPQLTMEHIFQALFRMQRDFFPSRLVVTPPQTSLTPISLHDNKSPLPNPFEDRPPKKLKTKEEEKEEEKEGEGEQADEREGEKEEEKGKDNQPDTSSSSGASTKDDFSLHSTQNTLLPTPPPPSLPPTSFLALAVSLLQRSTALAEAPSFHDQLGREYVRADARLVCKERPSILYERDERGKLKKKTYWWTPPVVALGALSGFVWHGLVWTGKGVVKQMKNAGGIFKPRKRTTPQSNTNTPQRRNESTSQQQPTPTRYPAKQGEDAHPSSSSSPAPAPPPPLTSTSSFTSSLPSTLPPPSQQESDDSSFSPSPFSVTETLTSPFTPAPPPPFYNSPITQTQPPPSPSQPSPLNQPPQ